MIYRILLFLSVFCAPVSLVPAFADVHQSNQEHHSPPTVQGEGTSNQVQDLTEEGELESNPLFRQFSAAFDDMVLLPAETDQPSSPASASPSEPPAETGNQHTDRQNDAPEQNLLIQDETELSEFNQQNLNKLKREIRNLQKYWLEAVENVNQIGHKMVLWQRHDPEPVYDMNPGPPRPSFSPWHLAINGPYFFKVIDQTDQKIYYTKAGDFEISPEGELLLYRTDTVYKLELTAPIPNEVSTVEITKSGEIFPQTPEYQIMSDTSAIRISLVYFRNPARLKTVDGVFFQETRRSGNPYPACPNSSEGIITGYLEYSNAQPDKILEELKRLKNACLTIYLFNE